jgi:hypothetical protein
MTAAAQKVTIQVKEFQIEAYQLAVSGELLFTHRQIGEAVGKTKGTAQKFLANHPDELLPPIKVTIPERRGAIALTPAESAVAYWQHQASQGNETAIALIAAIDDKPLSEFQVISEQAAPTQETEADESELQLIADGIEIASRWMEAAGVDKAAVAHWRLNELQKKVPELSDVVSSAQAAIAQNTTSPTGMIASQLAERIAAKLERKVTAAQVNKSLHELGLQDWAKPGVNRERKLTEAGKQYGVALLTTSADGWQGAQLRWFESVIPLLCSHLGIKAAY